MVQHADAHPVLFHNIKRALGMTKENWELARAHALSAVEHDTYVRAWAPNPSAGIALLYACDRGEVTNLHQPLGAQHLIWECC